MIGTYVQLRARLGVLQNARRDITNWWAWAARQALFPLIRIPMWVRARNGASFYLGNDGLDDAILAAALWRLEHVYFPDVSLPAAPLILDIGAHHGIVSVEYLRRYPQSSLIAVEPNPEGAALIVRNVRGNGQMGRAEVVVAGVAEQDGPGFLHLDEEGSWGDSTRGNRDGRPGWPVRLLTLKSILAGRRPDLVKINAEGAEFITLPQLFALGLRPRVIVAQVHAAYGSTEQLLELVRANGYASTKLPSSRSDQPYFHWVLA